MGLIHARKVIVVISGRDKKTGKVMTEEKYEYEGFVTSMPSNISERLDYLSQKFPFYEWEFVSMKD
jgi:hypothetical protein